MGTNIKRLIIITSITATVLVFAAYSFAQGDKYPDGSYVRGVHGKYCYSAEGMPKTIHSPIYFHSLQECLDSFNGK